MTNRTPDWRAKLVDYLTEWKDKPFEYGTADCWIFALGAAEVMTNESYIGKARGYDSLETGLAAIREHTGRRSHIDFVYRTFGKLPNMWMAMPGDIATLETPSGLGLGVVQGEMIFGLTEHDGLTLVPLESARGIYAVGNKDRT